MRRWMLATLFLAGWALAGCSSEPATPIAAAPTATLRATSTPAPGTSPPATPSPRPSPLKRATHTATLAPAPTQPPTPTLTPSPSPTPLPPAPPARGDPLPFSLGWQFNANGHLTGAAVAELGGRPVYLLTSLGRTLYALTGDGGVAWHARVAGPAYTLAVLAGERLAAGDDAGYVTVLDGLGHRVWRHDFGTRVTALHPFEGGVLAAGWDEQLTLLGPAGDVQWQIPLDGPVSAVTSLDRLVVAATADGQVHGLAATGAPVWRFEMAAAITNLAAANDLGILAAAQDGQLVALDDRGRPLWHWLAGAEAGGSPVWYVADLAGDERPEIVAGSGGASPVLALISARGEVMWQVAVPAPVNAITARDLDGDGRQDILAGLASGEIQAYDGEGRLRGSVHAGFPVWGLEAGPGGSVLVRADVTAWRLDGKDGPSGSPWLPPPALLASPPDPLPGQAGRKEDEAILLFLGDVALGRSMESQLARYGPAYPWQGLMPLLRAADLSVANLEGVLTTRGSPLDKPYLIRAHPRRGQAVSAAGFDLVTLANNHALDFGAPGLDETLDTLSRLGIATVGAGHAAAEAQQPALLTVQGVRIAVLGYAAARWDGSPDVPATDRIAWARPQAVAAGVRAVRSEADLVVVLLHAGTEYAARPSADQVAVAHAAIDAGADLVVGHHPHVTQTVEQYKQGLVVYSLGDAVFDIPRSAAMRGDVLRVHATRDGLIQAELWPFWITDAIQPRLLDDGQGQPRFSVIYP